jgi:phosphoribosylamine--glycine ligase
LPSVKVLVIGSGAREHAIVHALARDPDVTQVVAVPGNPGIALEARTRCVARADITDPAGTAQLCAEQGPDLVLIGPEAPLVAGVADAVRERGIACFGPSALAARLEGSKAFAKEVMAEAGVPTALAHVCTTEAQLRAALDATGAPYVVKDDGLAAGKGVVVTGDLAAAIEHGRRCLAKDDGRVVVEEFLDGPEVSLFCLTDGRTVLPLAPAQDFKRAGDQDSGPNTGGMGAYSPLPWADPELVAQVLERIARPTVGQMRRRGTPFAGVLYVGLALTARGPRVVEFNARFGDPETQVVLARLRTPLGMLLRAVAEGRLEEVPPLQWHHDAAVTVVLAAPGYPEAPTTGGRLGGLAEAAQVEGVYLLHAGTREDDDALVAAGGRVLSVVALGADLDQARQRAYAAMRAIDLPGGHYRTDIAAEAAAGTVTVPALQRG